ncbi:MAG: RluA family pseudouridine synthase [Anaerolineae bacterium]|nr:RluA family pseudouridine synthase [Anaerolineae bacterium]
MAQLEPLATPLTFTVTTTGERLDRAVVTAFPELSRALVQRLIEAGQVTLNGHPARAATKVRSGDAVTAIVPAPVLPTVAAEALPLDVLYEDADIVVVNKAPGMVVHPGAGNASGTLVNALLARCPDLLMGETSRAEALRPGIVHRLDKDTSGVLVVARHEAAIRALQRQFKGRTVTKRYTALLIGQLPQAEGIIDAPIARHPVHRQRMAVVNSGKPARTRWEGAQVWRDGLGRPFTLVDVTLLTGRTHQIRVHFSWLGYPLVGDTIYGPGRQPLEAPRQFLHARELTFTHPVTGEQMTFSAPLPDDLWTVLAKLVVSL